MKKKEVKFSVVIYNLLWLTYQFVKTYRISLWISLKNTSIGEAKCPAHGFHMASRIHLVDHKLTQ